jgi:predicted HTH transcriptional regulator
VLTKEEFESILQYGRETRAVEFKGPGSAGDLQQLATVIRAMLAMSNRRDGGRIIIGVAEQDGNTHLIGLNDDQLLSWSSHDTIADRVAAYSDPSVDFEIHTFVNEAGESFVLIEVEEFDSIPVICRKSYGNVLSEGACYVRPRRKPESVAVRSAADMRDLIELATEKELRRILATTRRAGVELVQTVSDADLYNEQLGEFG